MKAGSGASFKRGEAVKQGVQGQVTAVRPLKRIGKSVERGAGTVTEALLLLKQGETSAPWSASEAICSTKDSAPSSEQIRSGQALDAPAAV